MPYSNYALYKPFGYLSQFSDEDGNQGLKHIVDVEKDVYPIGRLDKDSEGLLLLSNNKKLNYSLLSPNKKHERTYLAQVDRVITNEAIESMKSGVVIKVGKSKYKTLPCKVKAISEPDLPPRNPPVRFRKNVPTSWVEIILTEGKNRQVRKMCASVGFPCLRLIRSKIEGIGLDEMQVGELRPISDAQLIQSLGIKNL